MTSEFAGEIGPFAEWLARFSGISTGIIGTHSLRRAIQQRQLLTGLLDWQAYHHWLLASQEEQQCLLELVVVPETWFFRDRHPYHYLRSHVAQRIRAGLSGRPLRLLSSPCASGEEPYSMAMTLVEEGICRDDFHIDAIDICRHSIGRAQKAVYGKNSFRGVTDSEKQRYFRSSSEGMELDPSIRDLVRFSCFNLVSFLADTTTIYDVIFCRNLLIYLQESVCERLLASLAAVLRPAGLLIVGSAETAMVPTSLFTPIRESFVFGFLRHDAPPGPQDSAPLRSRLPLGRLPTVSAAGSGPCRVASAATPSSHRGGFPGPWPGHGSGQEAALLPQQENSSDAAAAEGQLQRYRQDLQKDPACDVTYLRLGQWLRQHDRHEEAMDCLRRCLYLRPDCREAIELMIQLTQQLGLLERSNHYRQRLERLDR